MKEFKVNCTLYLTVEDDVSLEDAMNTVLLHLEPDIAINDYSYEFQEV